MEEFMGLRYAPLVVALAIGGCTYVSPPTYEEHIACLDEDRDGAVAKDSCADLAAGEAADCDDSRADRFPGNPEVPYDGIDQDCNAADLIDIDGDLYPGVLQADWTAQHGGITWPANLQPGLDCDDHAATTFPASGAEVPYDGVDSACNDFVDGVRVRDDWDFDRDNHVPPQSVHQGAAYTGTLPQDDCDDTRIDVYPGAQQDLGLPARPTDTAYDGIDHDCDHANDFDKDGDGFIEDSRVSAYLAFLALYGYPDDRPCKLTNGSCNDCSDDPANTNKPQPAGQIFPAATETWYDGLDQNCDGRNDFDQDLDGFPCDGTVDTACVGSVGSDCDDGLPDVNPGELELVGDSVDQDCSGAVDAPHFNFGDLAWTDPSTPDITRTDAHFVVGATGSSLDDGVASLGPLTACPTCASVVAAIFIADDQIDGRGLFDDLMPLEPQSNQPSQLKPVGRGVSLFGSPTVLSVGLSVFSRTTDERTRLRSRYLELLAGSNTYFDWLPHPNTDAVIDSGGSAPDPDPYLDFDTQKALDGAVWSAACSEETVHFTVARASGTSGTMDPTLGKYGSTLDGPVITGGGKACWLQLSTTDASDGLLHVYDGSVYRRFALDATVSAATLTEVGTPTPPHTAVSNVVDVRHRGDLVIFANGTPTVTVFNTATSATTTFTSPRAVHSVDISKSGTTFFAAAVVSDIGTDGKDDVLFWSWSGTPGPAADTHKVVPYVDGNGSEPTGVAIYAEATDLALIAVSGVSTGAADSVGWAFLGLAPP